jgi:hypothetical protein
MFVSKCPVCKELVHVASQEFTHAIVEEEKCRFVKIIPEDTDPKTIVVRLHEVHSEEFRQMVADGSWKPN